MVTIQMLILMGFLELTIFKRLCCNIKEHLKIEFPFKENEQQSCIHVIICYHVLPWGYFGIFQEFAYH